MYKRIILAVDLAETSRRPKGLEQALELAKLERRRVEAGQRSADRSGDVHGICACRLRRGAGQARRRRRWTTIVAEHRPAGGAQEWRLRAPGGIYHELLQEASDWNADLVVVGSHRPVMSDYLLGSNAKTIVRHAQCSVLVVRE